MSNAFCYLGDKGEKFMWCLLSSNSLTSVLLCSPFSHLIGCTCLFYLSEWPIGLYISWVQGPCVIGKCIARTYTESDTGFVLSNCYIIKGATTLKTTAAHLLVIRISAIEPQEELMIRARRFSSTSLSHSQWLSKDSKIKSGFSAEKLSPTSPMVWRQGEMKIYVLCCHQAAIMSDWNFNYFRQSNLWWSLNWRLVVL